MSYAALNTIERPTAPAERPAHTRLQRLNAGMPINILLVEDSASDVMLTEIALDATNVDYELHTLRNGVDVLNYLGGQGEYHDESKPDMLMLDLSLPAKDGFEVLADLAAMPERYGDLPIIILTGDPHCAFLKKSYDFNIVAYLTKPCSAEKIQTALAAIGWHTR